MIKKIFFFALYVFASCLELSAEAFKRPKPVQEAVDRAFEENKRTSTNQWHYNGSSWYGLLGIDEKKLVDNLVSSGKKEIYMMDVGCARGKWGRNIAEILEEKYKDADVEVHIFSITGGKECAEKTKRYGNVVLYQLNQFKIENIDEEMKTRGFDLENKVDLIVSRWTLRHLVDPFGTLDRLYGLLTPFGGKILSNGFLFKLDKDTIMCPKSVGGAVSLAHSNATLLFRDYDSGRDVGQFLLERNDSRSLNLPLRYAGRVEDIDEDSWQCASGTVAVVKKTNTARVFKRSESQVNNENRFVEMLDEHKRFCLNGDDRCKDLYDRLKEYGLFEKPGQ